MATGDEGKPDADGPGFKADPKPDPAPAPAAPAAPVPAAAPAGKPAATLAAKPGAAKPAAAKPAAAAPKPTKPGEPPIPEAPPWYRQLRTDPPVMLRMALGAGMVGLVMLLWWFLTHGPVVERIVSPVQIPSPYEVFSSLGRLLKRNLGEETMETLFRVVKGLTLAGTVGITFGVLAASQRGVNAALAPLVIFLRSVPMGALIPLTLMMFTGDEHRKTMFIFLAIVPFVFSDTVKAVSLVPERFVETAQTLGASRFQIIRKVLVPLALPDIVTSLRFQLGLALGYIMLVESDAAPGLGRLLNSSQRVAQPEHIYLLLFVITLIAFGLDLLLRTLQRGLFPWRRDL